MKSRLRDRLLSTSPTLSTATPRARPAADLDRNLTKRAYPLRVQATSSIVDISHRLAPIGACLHSSVDDFRSCGLLSFLPMRLLTVLLALAPLSGCTSSDRAPLVTAADSLAWDITQASGGLDAWDKLPALRFDWAVGNDSAESFRTHHLWNKAADLYRVEWPVGEDSILVAVFSPSTFDPEAPEGQVALNGDTLSGNEKRERLADAHGRYINDSYWLLAPLKVLDRGVRRELAPDSGHGVLALSFEGVGLTPGDRYWIESDPETSLMTGWTYVLEGSQDRPPTRWAWTDPQLIPNTTLLLPTRKVTDGRQIVTELFEAPTPDAGTFSDLTPRLSRDTP